MTAPRPRGLGGLTRLGAGCRRRLRRRVLVRADSGGGTYEFLDWLTAKPKRLHYSVGMTITEDIQAAIGWSRSGMARYVG